MLLKNTLNKKSPSLAYNHLLENLIILYFKANQAPKISLTKVKKIHTDTNYAKISHSKITRRKIHIPILIENSKSDRNI